MQIDEIVATAGRIREQVGRVVVGHAHVVNLFLVALVSEGHVLLEGVPGTAKTLLARTFAASLDLGFNRVQFTPDLMPGDVIGTNLFNFRTNEFSLKRGPVFTDVLLSDEINRSPPKTQAALLEAMQERAVTIDGVTHDLGRHFMVVATQNPIEQEGTYPLPEAQLDRFLFKIEVTYPARDHERAMVRMHGRRAGMPRLDELGLERVADRAYLDAARAAASDVRVSDEIIDYIVDVARATREDPSLLCGASPRAASMLASAARGFALLSGRDYVIPDDVKKLSRATLEHRLVLAPGAEIDGRTRRDVLANIVEKVAAPR